MADRILCEYLAGPPRGHACTLRCLAPACAKAEEVPVRKPALRHTSARFRCSVFLRVLSHMKWKPITYVARLPNSGAKSLVEVPAPHRTPRCVHIFRVRFPRSWSARSCLSPLFGRSSRPRRWQALGSSTAARNQDHSHESHHPCASFKG
ncbi:hypothetical protein L226DRAFT_161723 [Lentinus tigrinus ALCF2SS1-7]|uniref:uncharacterized protein n=1 Tax=Lentinus tigrinus ALCF2SS1-7 TaxID=1328758 RepID=UPI001165D12D|nr:hypothetical protein L226DRAFT_161723 [Lentinus tigrinus ALCF2SS1-7]